MVVRGVSPPLPRGAARGESMISYAIRYGGCVQPFILAIGAAMIPCHPVVTPQHRQFQQAVRRLPRTIFIFLTGIAAYGYRSLLTQSLTAPEGLAGLEPTPPLRRALSGAGLLFLRLYPLAMRALTAGLGELRSIDGNCRRGNLSPNSGQYMPLLLSC